MAAVNIHITDRNDFPCPVGRTVEEAEVRIRSARLLIGGEIQRNGVAMFPNDRISADGDYHFVNFQAAAAPATATSQGLISFRQEWMLKKGGELPDHVAQQWNFVNSKLRSRFEDNPSAFFKQVCQEIENIILTSTKNMIAQNTDLVIDGLLGGGGQGCIYYCILNFDIMIAKIGTEKVIRHEKLVSDTIHKLVPQCSTILFATGEYHVSQNRWAITLPLLSFTLEKLPTSYVEHLNFILVRTAVCILSALKAFTIAGYTHNDVKPANIGLQWNDRSPTKAVLFDLGSATTQGNLVESITYSFGLGEDLGTNQYDLACLISTVGTKAGFTILSNPFLNDYMQEIKMRGNTVIYMTLKAIFDFMRDTDVEKYDRMVAQMANDLGSMYAKCFEDINELFCMNL